MITVGWWWLRFLACLLAWVWLRTIPGCIAFRVGYFYFFFLQVWSFSYGKKRVKRAHIVLMWHKTTRSIAESERESLLLSCQSSLYSLPASIAFPPHTPVGHFLPLIFLINSNNPPYARIILHWSYF